MSDKDISKFTPNSEITIYETGDGKVKVEVYFANENFWLSQKLMAERADKNKTNMGITTWGKAPKGKILKSDISIAKNYLQKEEIKNLNYIVDMYLDYAELQASRGRLMKMKDWVEKLNAFLKFNEFDILQDKGKISGEVANALAEKEYTGELLNDAEKALNSLITRQ